jgi:hypothetical protein
MVRTPELTVDLARREFPAVTSYLSAWTDAQGLVIEGQDIGPGVSAIWGDSDYEYWLAVDREHLERVSTDLAKDLGRRTRMFRLRSRGDKFLLDLLKRSWERGLFETTTDFQRWLDGIGVPSRFSSYA